MSTVLALGMICASLLVAGIGLWALGSRPPHDEPWGNFPEDPE